MTAKFCKVTISDPFLTHTKKKAGTKILPKFAHRQTMNSQKLQPSEKSDRHLRVAGKSNGNTKKQHYTFYQIPDISNSVHFRAHRSIHLKHNMFRAVGSFCILPSSSPQPSYPTRDYPHCKQTAVHERLLYSHSSRL